MRNCLRLILCSVLLCLPDLLTAQTSATINGLKYTLNTNGTATLTGRSSTSTTEIYIPATVTNDNTVYRVTAIGSNAFSGGTIDWSFNNITKVTFETPSNVETIGYMAFYGTSFGSTPSTSGNVTLTIPGSVKSIAEGAFCWCGMEEIVFEEGVEKIGKGAFYDCHVSKVTFPNTLRSIGPYAFMWCGLRSVTIPEGVKSIGSFAFAFDQRITSFHLPSTLEYFGNSVLFYCCRLKDLTVHPDCPNFSMGEGNEEGILFNKDKSRLIFFSAEQQLLGRRFQYKVPTHVKEIGGGAFSGVGDELKSIVLPSTLEKVDSFAFIMNPLERITIPANTELMVGSIPSNCKEIFMMGNQGAAAIRTALTPVTLYPVGGITSRYYGGGITAKLYAKENYLSSYTSLAGTTIGYGEPSKITAVSSEIAVTTAKQLTTMCRDFDVDMTDATLANGVKAYIATEAKRGIITELDGTEFSGVYMTMKPIDYIPSRTGDDLDDYTGVVLLSEPGKEFKFKIGENDCFSDSQATLSETNLLEGAPCYMHILPSETEDGTTYRCYGLNNGRFKSYSAEGTLATDKAYLRIPNGYSFDAKEIVFSFDDDQPTGITEPHPLTPSPKGEGEACSGEWRGAVFDLQGRKIADNPSSLSGNSWYPSRKGIYIVNGKKIIIK